MNTNVLEQKLRALKLYPRLRAADIDDLGQRLLTLGEWDRQRMNPLDLAERWGYDAEVLLDLFIHAAKIGLFDFRFGQICQGCGGVMDSFARLDEIHDGEVHSSVCTATRQPSLDDFVEVTFEFSEALGVALLDPLASLETYTRTYRSANLVSPRLEDIGANATFLGFFRVSAGEKAKVARQFAPSRYRILNFESHGQLDLVVEGEPSSMEQVVDVDLLSRGFSPSLVTVRPGPVVVHVTNRTKADTGLILQNQDEFLVLVQPNRHVERRWKPFLTGKALLNNQSFRELFRVQDWAPDMKLKIKSLTILFTDLKGSTDMYGRVGDLSAYDVVQKHFDLLTEVVREHRGAIVKTMGDAIMATFSNSQDGVSAALAMVGRMPSLTTSAGHGELGIKVGVHEGPALAVNADDRLDYFGQNINLAARVQGLAEAGEIWLTQDVYEADGVKELVQASRSRIEPKLATLKGIAAPTPVYRLWM